MEKIMGKKSTKLITKSDMKNIGKYIKSDDLVNFEIINENLVLLHFNKKEITLDKPIYTGASILDISKKHMYDMIYNVIYFLKKGNIQICWWAKACYIIIYGY